jgi:hypothetical protein
MQRQRGLVAGMLCALSAAPAQANAQEKDEVESFMRDVVLPIFGPNWNLFAHGGWTTTGRLLLQSPSSGGQTALETEGGWNVGGGAGVDVLMRLGLRASYAYTSSELVFRTDNGDGSATLDFEHAGTLKSHVAAVEIIKYMAPARSAFSPYASVGILASWWVIDTTSTLITAPDGSSQFGWGPLASAGLQIRMTRHLGMRLEAATASTHNPFSGRSSFIALGGTTIEEPTRLNKTDWRIVAVYNF